MPVLSIFFFRSTEQSSIPPIVENSFEANPPNNLQNEKPQVETIPKYVHQETAGSVRDAYESNPNMPNSEIQQNLMVAQSEMNPTNPVDGIGDFNNDQDLTNTNEESMGVNAEKKQFEACGDQNGSATNDDPIGDVSMPIE